jgi:hypothetical protein
VENSRYGLGPTDANQDGDSRARVVAIDGMFVREDRPRQVFALLIVRHPKRSARYPKSPSSWHVRTAPFKSFSVDTCLTM